MADYAGAQLTLSDSKDSETATALYAMTEAARSLSIPSSRVRPVSSVVLLGSALLVKEPHARPPTRLNTA